MNTTHHAAGVPVSRPLTVSIRTTLGYFLLVIMTLTLIDGIIPQVEIAFFSGHILIPTVVLKYFYIGISLLGLASTTRSSTSEQLFMLWLITVAYLLMELLIFRISNGYSFIYIIYSFEATLYFLLLLPVTYVFRASVDEQRIIRLFMLLFVPLIWIGIFQFITNEPILPTESSDRFFQVFSWDFYGHVRAFSLFSSASSFGHYLALMAAMGVAVIATQRGRHRAVGALILLLSIVTSYMTLTRTTYIDVFLAIY